MKEKIRELALEMGFAACGFTHAGELTAEREPLTQWLDQGFHAQMSYMENHFEKRLNPSLLVEEAKTVIVLLFNYYPEKLQRPDAPQIAKYAYGEDYHFVFKEKLRELLSRINSEVTPTEGRVFTDSAPLLERALAVRAGLGWIGKNSLLINKDIGSFFMIGEILLDIELEEDTPFSNNHCGSCQQCINSCPPKAITLPGVVDSNLCISYNTIEFRGEFDVDNPPNLENRLFGCDICQDVCPWNKKSTAHTIERFKPHPDLLTKSRNEWENLTVEEYQKVFKKSAVKRTKYSGIMRNFNGIRKMDDQ